MPTELNTSSEVFFKPEVVSGGTNKDDTPVFFTVINQAGLNKMSQDGHFNSNGQSPADAEYDNVYNRIQKALGREDTTTIDGEEKPRLLIVESQKIDGKTVPARVFSGTLETTTDDAGKTQHTIHIIKSLNLIDGLPGQDVSALDINTTLNEDGKLSRENAKELNQQLTQRDNLIAGATSMERALSQFADVNHKPAGSYEGGAAVTPAGLKKTASGGIAA